MNKKKILAELIDKDDVDKFIASSKVGSVFKKIILPILNNYYLPFTDNFLEILRKLDNSQKKYPEFKSFIEKTNVITGIKSLNGILLQPILRTGAYEKMIDELVSLIPEGHKEGDPLRETADSIRKVNFSLAIKRRNLLNVSKLVELYSAPNDKIFLNDYIKIERSLLREGPINEVGMSINDSLERNFLYLFNDYIGLEKYS